MVKGRHRTPAIGQTGLGMFTSSEVKEKAWCNVCLEQSEVIFELVPIIRLACGHGSTREISISLEMEYRWNMECGWPRNAGGWYRTIDKDYPQPREMEAKIKMYPGIVKKIRERMGKDWNP